MVMHPFMIWASRPILPIFQETHSEAYDQATLAKYHTRVVASESGRLKTVWYHSATSTNRKVPHHSAKRLLHSSAESKKLGAVLFCTMRARCP